MQFYFPIYAVAIHFLYAVPTRRLGGDGPLLGKQASTLLVVQVDLLLLVTLLLDRLVVLGNNNLDVARVGHVGVDLWPPLAGVLHPW